MEWVILRVSKNLWFDLRLEGNSWIKLINVPIGHGMPTQSNYNTKSVFKGENIIFHGLF